MLRTDLVEKLERVSPALSNNNLVPILSHYWFLKDVLVAYNDQIAIQTNLKSSFAGAVPATLTSLLSVSRAKDIEFIDVAKNTLTVKAASSKIKLPYLDAKETEIFTMPEYNDEHRVPVDIHAFLDALESVMRSLKEDTSMPDSLGVTLQFAKDYVDLYATNDATISTARVKLKEKNGSKDRQVISGEFCRQMVALSKLDGVKQFELNPQYSLFRCGDTVLFGRLVDVARPLDFDQVIESSFPLAAEKQLVSIPTKLELILDRAIIITDSKQDRPKTDITVAEGVARFFSQSVERGEVHDQMQVEKHHPAVSVSIDPRLFKAGYGAYDKFLLTEQCLIMSKGASLYLVSASH